MQIKNSVLIFILGSIISTSSFAQQAEVASEGETIRTFTQATSSFQVAIIQPDTNDLIFRVYVKNPTSKRIDLKVFERKDIINSRTISTDFGASYNLNGLDDGDYSIVITDGNEQVKKNISIKTVFNVNRVISFASGRNKKSEVL